VVEGTEFVPSLGSNRERKRYYFWSPYPFYTMIKRRGKTLAQAALSKGLWDQTVKRSYPQQGHSNSSAIDHLSGLQERIAPAANNNKTLPIVSIETTNAQAIIPPQKSEQRENPSGIPAQSAIFVGFNRITQPLNAIRQRIWGTRRNDDATEEPAEEPTEEVSKSPVSNMDCLLTPGS
jgi:hypothetical protein